MESLDDDSSLVCHITNWQLLPSSSSSSSSFISAGRMESLVDDSSLVCDITNYSPSSSSFISPGRMESLMIQAWFVILPITPLLLLFYFSPSDGVTG